MTHNKPRASSSHVARPDLYINRELSWIDFNRRVFEEAKRERHPLLERVKFLSIFETNLDEFNMIRLAGLKDQAASSKTLRSPDGRTAMQQLAAVREQQNPLIQEVREYWRREMLPLLAQQHIHVLDYEQLDEEQRAAMRSYFEQEVFPVLTPLAVDVGHPFPLISSLSLSLAVVISDETYGELFARVKVPKTLPRLARVPSTSGVPHDAHSVTFVWLEQVIAAHLNMLFPGYAIWESYPFRVIRDADIELQEDEASDLLDYIEQEVRERRFGAVVDLVVNPSMPPRIRSLLIDKLEITPDDLTVIDGPLGMGDLIELHHLERPELKDPPFLPRTPAFLRNGADLFSVIRRYDLLMHHPYDSFNSVVDFISAAAKDPQVLAIKQTLYRTGSNSPIVKMLLKAAIEYGKQVAVLVELKARFDEENNITWARELENAGVHVVYGLVGLKTHAKIALVVRKEESGMRRYLHMGTGNYNASTAKIYEDFGFFTCRPDLCADASDLFNMLTGYSRQQTFRKLLVAPRSMRQQLLERIEREMRHQQDHGNGRMIFKMNALTDPIMIHALYRASQVGVSIDLIIRGICSLRPGVPGISEHIRVRSLVGRFLEHSRIYHFHNNGRKETYLGSPDLMQRNLNTRIETIFPIESLVLSNVLQERVLQPILKDTTNAHQLRADGVYERIQPELGEEPFDVQAWFIEHPLFDEEDLDHVPSPLSATPANS